MDFELFAGLSFVFCILYFVFCVLYFVFCILHLVFQVMIRTPSDPGIPYVHEIRSVSPSDTGMYTCVARNVVGRSVTSNVARNLYFDNHVAYMTYTW